jgi:argininosuccinate lyase
VNTPPGLHALIGERDAIVSNTGSPSTGRRAGSKSASYVRAVNEPEARASRHTARYMLASDIAYVLSAAELRCTPAAHARNLLHALIELFDQLEHLDTTKPASDIVAQRETWIQERVGRADAAWLHLGRNRGESLRCYLPRMYFRQALHDERRSIVRMLRSILTQAKPALETIAPNYHHLQHSGFTTLGEYLLSWAAVFEPHLQRIEQIDQRLDIGPSVFGGRTVVHELYDRVAKRLGFSRRAQLRRDGIWIHTQFTEPFFLLSLVAVDLARLAQDMRIWMTPEFSLFALADEHAGGSSALPHAKVPFGLQSVIGGATIAATRLAGELAAAINPSEGSEPIYQSASLYSTAADVVAWTEYMADVVHAGRFNVEEMKRKSTLDYAGSSEAHDRLVYDFGVPFRAGHRILGALVRSHHVGEPAPDLKAMIRAETGLDVSVDQAEITDIVLGRKLSPTTFDFKMLHETWNAFDRRVATAEASLSSSSPTDEAIQRLVAEAKTWIDANPT